MTALTDDAGEPRQYGSCDATAAKNPQKDHTAAVNDYRVILVASLLSSACLASAAGCTRESAQQPAPVGSASGAIASTSSSASVSASAPVETASAAPAGSANVLAKDCTAWGEHYARLMKKEGSRTIDDCPKGDFTSKELDDRAKLALEKEADVSAADLGKSCVTQLGKPYLARDAACFLKSQSISAWSSCRFESTFFVELAQKSSVATKAWPKKCSDMKKPGDEY